MERQIPKNVRQIGNVSDSPKIYVEDYVDTFFAQLCEKVEEEPIGAFLIGDIQQMEEEEYVYIYGAIQMHELKRAGNDYLIEEDTWKRAYEDCKQYFEEGEMLGWFVAHPGAQLSPEHSTVKLHKKSFPKKNTVFVMKDPIEKDEVYFALKFNDLMEIGGHYTYYEKNPSMQNYMISARKKNGVSPAETVEDRATKDFRNLVRNREEEQQQRKTNYLMYGLSVCLVLIVVIMGVTTLNNFDKMKSVQNALSALSGSSGTKAAAIEVSGGAIAGGETDKSGTGGQAGSSTVRENEAQSGDGLEVNAASENGTSEDKTGVSEGQNDGTKNGDVSQEVNGTSTDTAGGGSDAENKESTGTTVDAENGSDGVYIVEQGDTLAIISQKAYGDVGHVDSICRMNGLTDGNLIYIGQKLLLP